MDNKLFGVIAVLLVGIAGIGVYSAVKNPSQTANLVPAAVGAVEEAAQDAQAAVTGSGAVSSPTESTPSAATPSGREQGEDEDDENEGGDDGRTSGSSAQTQPATPTTQTQTQTQGSTGTTFTLAQVAAHKTASDCYTVVNGSVYNLSSFVNQHPGGVPKISSICGKDGTSQFEGQHGGGSATGIRARFT